MNALDIILLVLIAVVLGFAVRHVFRGGQNKKNCSGCCSMCTGCTDCDIKLKTKR